MSNQLKRQLKDNQHQVVLANTGWIKE